MSIKLTLAMHINLSRTKDNFPDGSAVQNTHVSAGDTGLIPGLGRSPGEGNGNPL